VCQSCCIIIMLCLSTLDCRSVCLSLSGFLPVWRINVNVFITSLDLVLTMTLLGRVDTTHSSSSLGVNRPSTFLVQQDGNGCLIEHIVTNATEERFS